MYIHRNVDVCDLIHTVCICRMLKYVTVRTCWKGDIFFISDGGNSLSHWELDANWAHTPALPRSSDAYIDGNVFCKIQYYLHTHIHTYKPNVDIYTCNIHSYVRMYICDWACENRPSECKKLPIFSVFTVS